MKTTGRRWLGSVAVVAAMVSAMTVGTAAPASADGYVNTFIQIFNLDIRCFLARDSLNANLPANTPPDTYYYCVENSVPYSHSYYALWYRHWVD